MSGGRELDDLLDEICDEILDEIEYECSIEGNVSSSNTRKKYIDRGREGHARLYNDYFSDSPVYIDRKFRRRFRMRKSLFNHIKNSLESRYTYFQETRDEVGKKSLSPHQKCTATMRMLAYGVAADAVDDYCRIGESTALECLKRFTMGVIEIFEEEYLRKPTEADLQCLLHVGAHRGFPGMLGSIDCMH